MIRIEYFEPGCISCEDCEAKPDDAWDTNPDGFVQCKETGAIVCEDCATKETV